MIIYSARSLKATTGSNYNIRQAIMKPFHERSSHDETRKRQNTQKALSIKLNSDSKQNTLIFFYKQLGSGLKVFGAQSLTSILCLLQRKNSNFP